MTKISEWLSCLGISRRALARRIRVAENCVSMHARTGKRAPEWIFKASLELRVPPEVLLNISPDDERARQYVGRALYYAAMDRLGEERRVKGAGPGNPSRDGYQRRGRDRAITCQ